MRKERIHGMSEKNMDKRNRWRNVTIAFRMSPEENEELDKRVKLCGYQTRQEYIIESVLYQKITAVGNPLMLVQFRKQLREIETELKRLNTLNDARRRIIYSNQNHVGNFEWICGREKYR